MFIVLAVFYLNFCNIEINGNNMEGFIVGGEFASIEMFPYSAHFDMKCKSGLGYFEYTACSAAILNKDVFVTAAHCFEDCKWINIIISVGHANKNEGMKNGNEYGIYHPNYDAASGANDIGLIHSSNAFIFNTKVSRVNIKRDPLYATGYIAGWGYVNERTKIVSNVLKYIRQPYIERETCMKILSKKSLPLRTICAGYVDGNSSVAAGYSGSALVVDNYQIGLVSHQYPSISKTVTIFTDVSYYYDWIMAWTHKHESKQ